MLSSLSLSSSRGLLWKGCSHRGLGSAAQGVGIVKNSLRNAKNGSYVRFLSTAAPGGQGGLSIGILRETYDPWERRTALCPDHVEKLLKEYSSNNDGRGRGLLRNVLVQPSSQRVFTDLEYEKAGATISDDLSSADLILGVKRPKREDSLLADKSYVFFSHVIKGQPENMKLLKSILDKRVQLLDYECIVEPVPGDDSRTRRVVAFGKYAGLAGMLNTFYPLGIRIMSNFKVPTPFLYCPPSSMNHTLQQAKENLQLVGDKIKENGLPTELGEPLVICVTGQGGNVHNGAMEVLTLLPHEKVSVQDLPDLYKGPYDKNKVYVVTPELGDLYEKEANKNEKFDFQNFLENPGEYRCTFKERIAPYIHALVNCVYWDPRFPRLLTKEETRDLHQHGQDRMLVVSDISCDIHGSIEFLEKSTSIAQPFFNYDPLMGRITQDDIGSKGITVMGVDILPTELPRESSTHFGDRVVKILGEFLEEGHGQNNNNDSLNMSHSKSILSEGSITSVDGKLLPRYHYLDAFMKQVPHEDSETDFGSIVFLAGHLFDSGLINQILDAVEHNGCHFEFDECHMGKSGGKDGGEIIKSSALLRITGDDREHVERVENMIQTLVNVIVKAEASMKVMERFGGDIVETDGKTTSSSAAVVEGPKEKNVLLLGAGRVSASCVRVLDGSEYNHNNIMVVSDNDDEARNVAKISKRGRHVAIDVANDVSSISDLVKDADIVISLLPATMHPKIAEQCIQHKTDLVTASYESAELRNLDERAKQAGIIMLNEVGLDPGLDHMSAMKIIDDIKSRGGKITSFKSVCGGLPEPSAADNPLKYKFSWSPKGVISASQNDARYRLDNSIVEVAGKELLDSAAPFRDAWPDLELECLPNRDSIQYEDVYDIQNVPTLFRGTLRYGGFSSQFSVFKKMGLFDATTIENKDKKNWGEVLQTLAIKNGFERVEDFILNCVNEQEQQKAFDVLDTLRWLGVAEGGDGTTLPFSHDTIVDSFSHVLESKLEFKDHEHDLVLMHHDIQASFDDGDHHQESHTSSLKIYGDDEMSAMCRTVGTPTAVAADLLVGGKFGRDEVGLVLPTDPSLYLPILQTVEKDGIVFDETMTVRDKNNNSKTDTAIQKQHV